MYNISDKPIIKIDRKTLQKIFPDNESLRKFEELLRVLNDLFPEDLQGLLSLIEDNSNDTVSINSKLNALLSVTQIIKTSIDYLEKNTKHRFNPKPKIDYLDFNKNQNVAQIQGRLSWNSDDITLNLYLNDSVTLQIGQEILYLVKNTSGATIPDGKVISYSGTIGASGKIKATLGIGTDNPEMILGISTQTILNNEFGFVTDFGLVRGIDTSMWADEDFLYPSPTIAGELTNIQPSAPNFKRPIAVVIYSHSNIGSIFVRMKSGESISMLHDVEITSLADNDILQYNSVNQRWENIPMPVSTGASGMFISADGKTITVLNGLVTNIT